MKEIEGIVRTYSMSVGEIDSIKITGRPLDVRSQGGRGFVMCGHFADKGQLVKCGHFLYLRTSALFGEKNIEFFKIYGVTAILHIFKGLQRYGMIFRIPYFKNIP